jgi:hypothetical protein
VPGERFDGGAICRAKNQKCSICRVVERARQEQFAAAMRLACELKMLFAVCGPPRHEVVDHVVEQRKVVQVAPPTKSAKCQSSTAAD